jgi:hypothetical protein
MVSILSAKWQDLVSMLFLEFLRDALLWHFMRPKQL